MVVTLKGTVRSATQGIQKRIERLSRDGFDSSPALSISTGRLVLAAIVRSNRELGTTTLLTQM